MAAKLVIDISYLLTAVLFILGLKRMSHPTTARSGIWWAGGGYGAGHRGELLPPGNCR